MEICVRLNTRRFPKKYNLSQVLTAHNSPLPNLRCNEQVQEARCLVLGRVLDRPS